MTIQRDRRFKRQSVEEYRGIESVRRCAGTRQEEDLKESIADEMLRAAGNSNERPAYPEPRLERQVRARWVIRLDAISDTMLATRPSEEAIDELKFVAALTPLSQRERFFIRGWMLGWTQERTAERWLEQVGPGARFNICRVLKGALHKCRANMEISFRAASIHALYRKPARRAPVWRTATCPYCKEPFIKGFGDGVYCCVGCRSAANRRL